jgi:hypothetical protein
MVFLLLLILKSSSEKLFPSECLRRQPDHQAVRPAERQGLWPGRQRYSHRSGQQSGACLLPHRRCAPSDVSVRHSSSLWSFPEPTGHQSESPRNNVRNGVHHLSTVDGAGQFHGQPAAEDRWYADPASGRLPHLRRKARWWPGVGASFNGDFFTDIRPLLERWSAVVAASPSLIAEQADTGFISHNDTKMY